MYRFDADKGALVANDPAFAQVAAGAGPRHFAIHPNGFAYVINEMNMTVTGFRRDLERGSLTELQTISTLPPGQGVQSGFSTADVQVHPSGRFLYGSNRGHDSIVVFAIDEKTGRLTYVENRPTQGSTPRGFGIDPSGSYLLAANQRSDSVVVFRIDKQTGRLTPTGQTIEVGAPVCVNSSSGETARSDDHASFGSVNAIVVPRPGSLEARISPPCAATEASRDRQAESRAPRLRSLVETIERARDLFRRHAASRVAHVYGHAAAHARRDADDHRSARGRVAQRVRQQIADHLADANRDRLDRRQIVRRIDLEPYTAGLGISSVCEDDVAGESGRRRSAPSGAAAAAF